MDRETVARNFRRRIFWITHCIAQGPFPTDASRHLLIEDGITHVFNVSDAPSQLQPGGDTIRNVADFSVFDGELFPPAIVMQCLESLHACLNESDAKLYIHCLAGHNRSPTMLWLYLIACGMELDEAKSIIEVRNPDAVAGNRHLVDDQLIEKVLELGRHKFLPLTRPTILEPA